MTREWDAVRAAEKAAKAEFKRQEGLEKFLAQKKAKVANVMDRFQTRCQKCDVTSGKTKIYHLDEGYFCGRCLPNGLTPQTLLQDEQIKKDHIKAEENKPKPENYGDWA